MLQGDGAFDFLAEEERASKHAKGRLDPGFNEQQMAVLEDTEVLVGQRDGEINNIGMLMHNPPGGGILFRWDARSATYCEVQCCCTSRLFDVLGWWDHQHLLGWFSSERSQIFNIYPVRVAL